MYPKNFDEPSDIKEPGVCKKQGLILSYFDIFNYDLLEKIYHVRDCLGIKPEYILEELIDAIHSSVENIMFYEELADRLYFAATLNGYKVDNEQSLKAMLIDVLVSLDLEVSQLFKNRPVYEIWSFKAIEGDTLVIERRFDELVEAYYKKQEERSLVDDERPSSEYCSRQLYSTPSARTDTGVL